ncbi:MAG TPA: methyltransferase domain-containing protein [Pyrinomonadaceae bacterium]
MLKRAIVRLLGREQANRVSAPYHDWQARRRTARNLAALPAKDLCVNLGCGPAPMAGWVNVDISRGAGVDVVWDLRRGLPFADESCSAIFCEHVIEHLSKEDGLRLLRESRRALQQGGVLRLSTPDAGRFLRSYAGDGEFLSHPEFPQAAETPIDRINMMMREDGQHLWVYDSASLLLLLRRAGFSACMEQQFGVSQHPRMQNIDTQGRAFESFYVEAVR